MILGITDKKILRDISECEEDYEYFVNYLLDENNINNKEYQTIKSIIRYILKSAIIPNYVKIGISRDRKNSEQIVVIYLDSIYENISIPKDWYNIVFKSKDNNKLECKFNSLNKDYSLMNFNKYNSEYTITINNINNLYIKQSDYTELNLILDSTLNIFERKSVLELVYNIINQSTLQDIKNHLIKTRCKYRKSELARAIMVIYKLNLVSTYKQKFEELNYKIYTLYSELENRLNQTKIEDTVKIVSKGANKLYKTYIDICLILSKEIEQWH